MLRSASLLLLVLAACPARGPGGQPARPIAGGAGCPTAANVHVASYLTQDGAARGGHTGWVLPLHDLKIEALSTQPEYAAIDAATAGALGVPPAPANAWLMVPGQAPCKLTIGSYYGAAVDAPSPNVTYGVELAGCAAPPADQQQDAEAIVVVSDQAPSGCQILPPQPVAARLGETDAQRQWQRPTKETAIPPAVARAVPPHECRAPDCETLWAIAQVTVAGRPVAWAGAVNWLAIPPGAPASTQCDWKAETFAGFFVAAADGTATRVTEGQDHPLLLTAVLADASGAKVLVAEGAGEYATYDLGGGAATLARHLVWLVLPADAYAVDDHLGPSCAADEHR
ncbi:MAG: hypothetical protein ABIY55_16555 [Kofleriaceae bacterium]